MNILTGQLLAVADRNAEYNGERWTERVLHLLDGLHTTQVTLLRPNNSGPGFDESLLPAVGSQVALEVWPKGSSNKRVYFTAVRVLSEVDIAQELGLLDAASA